MGWRIGTGKQEYVFPPSGVVARVATVEKVVGICPLTGAEIVQASMSAVEGLPSDFSEPVLVSAMVLAECKGLPNVFAPDTGSTAIRNEKGHIVAVTRLKKA